MQYTLGRSYIEALVSVYVLKCCLKTMPDEAFRGQLFENSIFSIKKISHDVLIILVLITRNNTLCNIK